MIEPTARITVERAFPTNRKKLPRAAFSAMPTRPSGTTGSQLVDSMGTALSEQTVDSHDALLRPMNLDLMGRFPVTHSEQAPKEKGGFQASYPTGFLGFQWANEFNSWQYDNDRLLRIARSERPRFLAVNLAHAMGFLPLMPNFRVD